MGEITLQERISILDGFFALEKEYTPQGHGNTITDSWDEIRGLLGGKMNKWDWISVEDSLPEEGKRILYYSKRARMGIGAFSKVTSSGPWFAEPDGFLIDGVTHWMSLPEHPEGV